MELNQLLIDLFDRIADDIHEAVDGLDVEILLTPPEPGTNTIAWLVWHLTRVQDDHVADILGEPQLWSTGGWARSFGVAADDGNTGYGHSWKDVMAIKPENGKALIDYYEAVATRTRHLLERTTAADLDRIVDKRWDPPVSLGVRLVSIADDNIQHAGQASYARGMFERR